MCLGSVPWLPPECTGMYSLKMTPGLFFFPALSITKTCNGVPGLCDLPYNKVTLPSSHTSAAYGLSYDWVGEIPVYTKIRKHLAISQRETVAAQLEDGIRAFDIEPCCTHGESYKKVRQRPNLYMGRLMRKVLSGIQTNIEKIAIKVY